MSKDESWRPGAQELERVSNHVAWEYCALLAAALEMANAPKSPRNHQAQESFLLHLRNLADFFSGGSAAPGATVSAPPSRSKERDDIYAVDLSERVGWDPGPFARNTKLRQAMNKTLAHMTYSRDSIDVPFDGWRHLHGTVKLVRKTWQAFLGSLRSAHRTQLARELERHASGLGPLDLNGFDEHFERLVSALPRWLRDTTPDSDTGA